MKRSLPINQQKWVFAMTMAVLVVPAVALAQEDSEAFITKPTPQHELLARDVGTWDATMSCYMAGPETNPQTFKGVEVNTLMDGGLWLLSDFQGDFAGTPFRGHGLTGYDPEKQKHVGTWIDTMCAQMMIMEGTYDEQTGTLTMYSKGTDPSTGKPAETKTVSAYDGEDSRTFTMFMKGEDTGNDFVKMMVIEYKRRK